ncbi:MAG: lysylphosphatidylglycerol synthase transmembrane domain-containing protein [Ilumatobacteraceae bacterium]
MVSISGLRSTLTTLKWVLFAAIVYFFILPLIPGFRNAVAELSHVTPSLLVVGLALEMAALFAYSMLTHAVLGTHHQTPSVWRLFRIQMSTKAVGNILPGGSAASSALGYRLLTLSGVSGPDAGFALATAGLGSAVVLNLILWVGLIASIPGRGVNAAYGTAALVGVIVMLIAAALIFGLIDGQGRAERALRWCARTMRFDEDRAAEVLRHMGNRLQGLASEPGLLWRVLFWATVNWLLDAVALWVFLRAFGASLDFDALIVSFGLANIMSVVPITPGGLGIVEGIYIPTLIGFGLTRNTATVGVLSYRVAQYWVPIIVGGVLYLTLRVGPFAIERRQKLKPIRRIAADEVAHPSSRIHRIEHYAPRDRTGQFPLPDFKGMDDDDDIDG